MAKILIVDDSNSMRQMINFTLKSAGHEITEAVDGMAGLVKAKTAKFDLVITDINMPNMTGIEFTRQLRTQPDYKFTPILMLTTEVSVEKKQEGKAAGATGWIVKPFKPEDLLATVGKVIK